MPDNGRRAFFDSRAGADERVNQRRSSFRSGNAMGRLAIQCGRAKPVMTNTSQTPCHVSTVRQPNQVAQASSASRHHFDHAVAGALTLRVDTLATGSSVVLGTGGFLPHRCAAIAPWRRCLVGRRFLPDGRSGSLHDVRRRFLPDGRRWLVPKNIRRPRSLAQRLDLLQDHLLALIAPLLLSQMKAAQILAAVMRLFRQQTWRQQLPRHVRRAKPARHQVHVTTDTPDMPANLRHAGPLDGHLNARAETRCAHAIQYMDML